MLLFRRCLLPLMFYCVFFCLNASIGGQAADPKRDYELVFENFTCTRPTTATATMTTIQKSAQTTSKLVALPHLSSTTTKTSLKFKTSKQPKVSATTTAAAAETATANVVATSVMASRELGKKQQQQQQRQQQKQQKPNFPQHLVQRLICGLNKNSKRRTLQMEMSFSRQLQNFDFNLLIILPRKYTENFILLNLTRIDGCQFLSNKNLVTLLQLGRANLNHYSNYPNDCPLLADTVYYIRNYRWSMDSLPAFTIETDIHIFFDYIVDGEEIIKGFIKARLDVKTSKKDLGQLFQF